MHVAATARPKGIEEEQEAGGYFFWFSFHVFRFLAKKRFISQKGESIM
jgi:hypothetical protein